LRLSFLQRYRSAAFLQKATQFKKANFRFVEETMKERAELSGLQTNP